MRLLVVGSRTFGDYGLLADTLDDLLLDGTDVEIVSGGAKGADSLAERYAKEKGYRLTIFSADWSRYGKSAGWQRNVEMRQLLGD